MVVVSTMNSLQGTLWKTKALSETSSTFFSGVFQNSRRLSQHRHVNLTSMKIILIELTRGEREMLSYHTQEPPAQAEEVLQVEHYRKGGRTTGFLVDQRFLCVYGIR